MEDFFFKKIVSANAMKTMRYYLPLAITILIYSVIGYVGWRYT